MYSSDWREYTDIPAAPSQSEDREQLHIAARTAYTRETLLAPLLQEAKRRRLALDVGVEKDTKDGSRSSWN